MSELELTVTRRIAAPRDKVFNAWLSPKTLSAFMLAIPESTGPSIVTTDATKGGNFSITMRTVGRDVEHHGTYLAVEPHTHLSFTWGSQYSPDDSVVTIDFAEVDAKTTDVTLKQVKFHSVEARDSHSEGWTHILSQLDRLAA